MPSYQLAISNIAWQKDDDETVYAAMQQAGFTGLELAPTRIFSEAPYENLTSALLFGLPQKPLGLLGAQSAKHLVRPEGQYL